MINTVVVEPHALLRLGMLQQLSQAVPELRLNGVAPHQLGQADTPRQPAELVLLAWREGQDIRAGVAQAVQAYGPNWILLLYDGEDVPAAPEGLPAVVAGCVSSCASPEVLAASIRLVLAGGKCFPSPAWHLPDSAGRSVPARAASAADPADAMRCDAEAELLKLTPRQYEVLVLLARGYPIKTVSRQLNISVATAKAHAGTLYQRLNVRNKSEAVYAAVTRGAKLDWH